MIAKVFITHPASTRVVISSVAIDHIFGDASSHSIPA